MLKLIHKNKQALGIFFLFVAFCFAISGIGIDIMHGGAGPDRNAIQIDDHEITFREVQLAERRLENQYQNMFGENYHQLAQSLGLDLTRQAVDNLIETNLIEREARRIGFEAGADQVREVIREELFNGSGGFSREQYRAALQSMGLSASQFEAQVRDDIVRTSLAGLLTDVAYISTKDVESGLVRQETKYSLVVARFAGSSLVDQVPAPTDEAINRFYELNATDYELPARVSYEYVVLDPKDFEKDVNVTPQDVEFAYGENMQKYALPEQARIRSIKVLYPKESDPKKMAAAREKAKKAHEEAVSGKPFESLVTTYSEDLPTKLAGGSRGWVAKGKGTQTFDAAVFETPAGSVAPLIEEDWGFEIVKVEETKEAGQRPLDEVRAEIESEIKRRESPGYALAKANELATKASGTSFEELVKAEGLALNSTGGLLDASKDPLPTVAGLTRKALELAGGAGASVQVVELGDTSVLVRVTEYRQPEVSSLETVKEKVIEGIKREEAKKLASQKAQELLELAKGSDKGLKAVAEEKKATVNGPAEISRANPASPELAGVPNELTNEAFKVTTTPPVILDRVFEAGDVFLVAQVTEIKKPELTSPEVSAKLNDYRTRVKEEASKRSVESALAALKASSDIEIDDSLLVR